RLTVCGPPGVPYTYGCCCFAAIGSFLQLAYLTGFLIYRQVAVQQGYTRTVISTVFQPLQAFNQYRKSVFITYITNDAAHMVFLFSLVLNKLYSTVIYGCCALCPRLLACMPREIL